MALTVNKPFVLTTAEGEKKSFGVGEKITGELAKHWYVIAHCLEDSAMDQDEPQAEEVKEPTARRGRPPKGN